jgi:hypothetical protein
MIRKVLPNEHKPYIIIYPRGNVTHKLKNKMVLGANHTIEHLLEAVSGMLPDTIEVIENDQLETRIVKSLFDRKLTLVIFHGENEVSLGLRRLALSPYYRKYFDFYQMRHPPKDRLKQLGIRKLNKLVMFMADAVLLSEPDSMPPIDHISYELTFIFDKLKMFLDDMIEEHGVYLQDVKQVTSEEDLEELLFSTRKRYFLLFMLDKAKELRNDQLVDRMNDMLVLTKFGGSKTASAYIDVNCFPQLTETFRFRESDLPLLVIYDSVKKSYLRSEFKLNIYDGKDLIEKSVFGNAYKGKFRNTELQLGLNKCKDVDEKIDL